MNSQTAYILENSHCCDIVDGEEFTKFSDKVIKLQHVDLSLLKTDQQKRAFFINLHNLLSLHGVIMYMASVSTQQVCISLLYPKVKVNIELYIG